MMLNSCIFFLLILLLPAEVAEGKLCCVKYSIRSLAATRNNTDHHLFLRKSLLSGSNRVSSKQQHPYATTLQLDLLLKHRGGGNGVQISDEEDDDADEYDNYDEEEGDEEEEEEEDTTVSSLESSNNAENESLVIYDEPWVINPINNFMVQLAVMLMCRKVDMKEYRTVRLARYVLFCDCTLSP